MASGLNVPFQSKQVRGNLEQLFFEVFINRLVSNPKNKSPPKQFSRRT